MKKYQINSNVLVAADGWVIAKNVEEAKKKWTEFCFDEMCGLSVADVEIHEVITPRSRHYDKENIPDDSEFHYDCLTHNYLK